MFDLFRPLITDNSIQYANYEDGRQRRAVYDPAFQHEALEHYFSVFVKVLCPHCLRCHGAPGVVASLPQQQMSDPLHMCVQRLLSHTSFIHSNIL